MLRSRQFRSRYGTRLAAESNSQADHLRATDSSQVSVVSLVADLLHGALGGVRHLGFFTTAFDFDNDARLFKGIRKDHIRVPVSGFNV